MKIKKGQLILCKHCRKGHFKAIAEKDFDTNKDEFYPLILAEERVEGLNTEWLEGEIITARKGLCKIEII